MLNKEQIKERIRNRIIYYLSKRDYSIKELKTKIILRIEDSKDFVDDIINELEKKGYISEERFIDSFIRYKRSQYNGKQKIQQELKLKGIKESDFKPFFEIYHDWFDLAYELKIKKFGFDKYKDFNDKNKKIRYLVSRGFSFEESKYAIEKDN